MVTLGFAAHNSSDADTTSGTLKSAELEEAMTSMGAMAIPSQVPMYTGLLEVETFSNWISASEDVTVSPSRVLVKLGFVSVTQSVDTVNSAAAPAPSSTVLCSDPQNSPTE